MKKSHQERRDIHAEITGKIIAQLEKGVVPWLRPWRETGVSVFGIRPRNAITKRHYSGINVLLLWAAADEAGYQSNDWLTFKQASDRGGNVRKGEKATEVVLLKKTTKKVVDEAGNEEEKSFSMLRSFYLFNAEQCDNLKLPADRKIKPRADVNELNPEYAEAVKATGIKIKHGGDDACYIPSIDVVLMPELANFKNAQHYEATLAHELIHATCHKSRLDRPRPNYCLEELVAELGAAFTCAEFGIRGELRHADYIGHWIKALKDDTKAVISAASKASKAVAFLYPETKQADLQEAA